MSNGLRTNLNFLLSLIEFKFHEIIFVFICLLVKYFAPELLHRLIIHFQVNGDPQPIKAVYLAEGKTPLLCGHIQNTERLWK